MLTQIDHMRFLLFPLILMSLYACNAHQNEKVNKEVFNIHNSKAAPVTSVSEIEAVGIKDYTGREINYVYKVLVDSSANETYLLAKMYQVQRKTKLPFTRPIHSPMTCRYSFTLEQDVSIFDNISHTIIGLDQPSLLFSNLIGESVFMKFPNNLITLDYFYFSCLQDSATKSNNSIALVIESFPTKQKADSMLVIVKTVAKNAHLIKQPAQNLYFYNGGEQTD